MAEEILRKLLCKIVKDLNFVEYDLEIEPVSSGGANYTSTLYNVTVTEGERVVYMFAKVAAVGQKLRSQAPRVFENEQLAYTKLLKVYEQLEEKYNVPQEHRLIFSKCYGYNPNMFEETIVLENLVMSGYETYDRFKSVDWEYAKSAFSSLAKMHALSFAYGEYYPEKFNKIFANFKFELDPNKEEMSVYFKSMLTTALNVLQGENRDKLEKFFEVFDMTSFPDFSKWTRKPVVGHGDFRPSNLMHRIREDGSIETKILDLQTLQGSSPIVDLVYFIFCGSDEEFREKYYERLLDHYYTELHAAMTRLHLNPEEIYSRDDFDSELQEKLKFGLILVVWALPVITMDADDTPIVNEDLDLNSFTISKTNDLYRERLNGIINDYVKLGVLK